MAGTGASTGGTPVPPSPTGLELVHDAFCSLGYKSARRDQMDVITQFVRGNDVFVSRSGKSIFRFSTADI